MSSRVLTKEELDELSARYAHNRRGVRGRVLAAVLELRTLREQHEKMRALIRKLSDFIGRGRLEEISFLDGKYQFNMTERTKEALRLLDEAAPFAGEEDE